ncbi:MAG: NADPH:quinone oxidoreductase family protein [Pseudomonadota bacterium]
MRALVCHKLTDDLSGIEIRDVEPPTPAPGQVLIKVRATSINFPDILLCQGKYQLKLDPPFTPGMDIAGTVAALGEGVTEFAIGDDVCGGARFGGFAEYAAVAADGLQAKPGNFSFEEAASYSAAYITAYVALVRRGRLQAGETVLIHGASGGVGMAAVDVAKLLGASVIATGGSDDKLAQVAAYGADHVINTKDGFREQVKALTDGRGADVIYDPVGGDVFDESVRCIGFDGRLLVIGFTSGRIASVSTNMPLIKGFSVVGVRAGEYGRRFPERGRENVKQIWDWAKKGATRPYVHDCIPLDQTVEGFKALLARKVVGKMIVNL